LPVPLRGIFGGERVEPDRAQATAEHLFRWRTDKRPMTRLAAELCPADEGDAYQIQSLLHEKLTAHGLGPVSGHKIGCTTPVMQAYLGIGQPCAGGIFAHSVQGPLATVRAADYVRLGVECEIAVLLKSDISPESAPYDRRSVGLFVDGVTAAMELVDDRYDDFSDFGVASLIADDFFNTGCVLGAPVTDWQNLDLAAITGAMWIDEAEIGRGSGADIMGHPLEALAWIANLWAQRGLTLRAGSFVMLGSVVQTQWLEAGNRVRISIDGLGEATLRVE
jgi:2-keto-4-pentenoate hydratase